MEHINTIKEILGQYFPINRAKIDLMAQMILALVKVRIVTIPELSVAFSGTAKPESNERRIRRFLSNPVLDFDRLALFIGSRLPKGKWLLTIDRTNWDFGKLRINILVLGVVYKGVAIPLLWTFLKKQDQPESGKKGNSNTKERIELMNRFIRLFGVDRIEGLDGDREFIGSEWFNWLQQRSIPIFIRVKENQYGTSAKGRRTQFKRMFRNLKVGQARRLKGVTNMDGIDVFVTALRLPNFELLIVATFHECDNALEFYAKRWEIETLFAHLKTKGFRFESTHLTKLGRIDILLGIVTISFVWCYLVGDNLDSNYKRIPFKNHGYRSKSILRYGLDHFRRILLNLPEYINEFKDIIKILAFNVFSHPNDSA